MKFFERTNNEVFIIIISSIIIIIGRHTLITQCQTQVMKSSRASRIIEIILEILIGKTYVHRYTYLIYLIGFRIIRDVVGYGFWQTCSCRSQLAGNFKSICRIFCVGFVYSHNYGANGRAFGVSSHTTTPLVNITIRTISKYIKRETD